MTARALSIAVAASLADACERSDNHASSDLGPRITLDSAALARATVQRRLRDKLAHDSSAETRRMTSNGVVGGFQALDFVRVQETLAHLGYAVAFTGENDEPTRRAVSAFEARHALPITNDPMSPTFQAGLDVAAKATGDIPTLPPKLFSAGTWNQSVFVKGTWAPWDFPIQTSEITCLRAERRCLEAVATIMDGELSVTTNDYVVQRWDSAQLVATMNAICIHEELSLNRVQQTAVVVRSNIGDAKACDTTFRAWSRSGPQLLRLVDGSAVRDSLVLAGLRFVHLAPAARAHVDSMLAFTDSARRHP